jgi:hypothetical protein
LLRQSGKSLAPPNSKARKSTQRIGGEFTLRNPKWIQTPRNSFWIVSSEMLINPITIGRVIGSETGSPVEILMESFGPQN